MKRFLLATVAAAAIVLSSAPAWSADKLLNASYDVARELFAAGQRGLHRKAHPGVTIDQSHAGTSKQARAIVEGLEADVVTFNQVTDIDFLVKNGFVSDDWQKDFPNKSSPFYSLPSFLVRAGNPKDIKDWGDLVRDDVQVIFPNPKTSGNARYTYLAATAYAKEAFKGDEAKVKEFVTELFDNVPVFDTGGRAATTTFVEREIGDVLITFESETTGIRKEFGEDKFEAVVAVGQPAGRIPGRHRRQGRRRARHARSRQDLSRLPLHAGGPEDRRRKRQPRARREGGRGVQGQVPRGPPGDGRGRLRRLDEGPGGTFRLRRAARPDFRHPLRAFRLFRRP